MLLTKEILFKNLNKINITKLTTINCISCHKCLDILLHRIFMFLKIAFLISHPSQKPSSYWLYSVHDQDKDHKVIFTLTTLLKLFQLIQLLQKLRSRAQSFLDRLIQNPPLIKRRYRHVFQMVRVDPARRVTHEHIIA